MRVVANSIPNVKLLILGAGEQLDYLKNMCTELELDNNIEFLGFLKNPYSYMLRADMYVISSIFEGLPGVLIEALILGKPCVNGF